MYSVPINMGEADRGSNVGPEVCSAVTAAEVETATFVAEGPAVFVAEVEAAVVEVAAVVGA
jgi:PAB1-binding protein PBP1